MHPFRLRLFLAASAAFLALTSCRPFAPGPGQGSTSSGWAQASGSCGITRDERPYCWGWDAEARVMPPAPLGDGLRLRFVTGTLYQGCGLARDGAAHCWGLELLGANRVPTAEGCGGAWQRPCALFPTAVSASLRFRSLSVGGEYGERACGLTGAGEAYCWGKVDHGQGGAEPADTVCLPHGCYAAPSRIEGPVAFQAIAAGGGHSCALDGEGQTYCWGSGSQGQLGREAPERCPELSYTVACSRTPVAVGQGELRFAQITAGAMHTCALTTGGEAYCWGANVQGQLGTEATLATCESGHFELPCSAEPVPVAGSRRFRQISAHGSHTCAVAPEGEAYCWGEGRYGQLGQGVMEPESPYGKRRTPVRVVGGASFAEVSASGVCGRTGGEEVHCWGIHSPDRDVAAPLRIPDPPEHPLLLAFTPGPAPERAPPGFFATTTEGLVRVKGMGPAHCANHGFHAAATRTGRDLELWVVAGRWEGGGCLPTGASFAYEAVLGGLEPGRYRLRVLHHFTDDRGQVRRDRLQETEVEVP